MCTVSMIFDHYREKWNPQPGTDGGIITWPLLPAAPTITITPEEITEFKKLLERAREYDKRNHEPDCELAEKRIALKKIADALGIDISFIDPPAGGADGGRESPA